MLKPYAAKFFLNALFSPLLTPLAFKDVVAEIEKLPHASLEGLVVEHVGGIKKRVTPVVTKMVPASASGSEIAEMLSNQPVIVSWGLFGAGSMARLPALTEGLR